MLDSNPKKAPEKGKWEFWKVDFSKKDIKTGTPAIEYADYLDALRITPNGSLAIQFNEKSPMYGKQGCGRIYYVPEEYYNSSSSPVFMLTNKKKYGYIIRQKVEPISSTEEIALIALASSSWSN
jgi:hypothetical protein